jgi:hypothetical protein
MSFKGGCDFGCLALPYCLFVRRQCCRKLAAASSDNFFKLCHATLNEYTEKREGNEYISAKKVLREIIHWSIERKQFNTISTIGCISSI